MGGIRKFKEDYIPASGVLNRSQKTSAKEAILLLLSQKKHTEVDIAEHFGMSLHLVIKLVKDLEKARMVVREKGSSHYIINNKVFLG